jgi:hypothetical protein
MTVLAALGRDKLFFWRLDQSNFRKTWDRGEGRPNCALDASTAILEVDVHKGFNALNVIPHTISYADVLDPDDLLTKHKFVAITSTISPTIGISLLSRGGGV